MGNLYLSVSAIGRLSITARHRYRPPSGDSTLIDEVNVMLPLHLAVCAVASEGVRALARPADLGPSPVSWGIEVAEQIAFPNPLAGSNTLEFPGPGPDLVPRGDGRPEPSELPSGDGISPVCAARPGQLAASVLGDLLAH